MTPTGLLSILLAAGIILGIGLALFGVVKREQGKTLRVSGTLMLFACLFALMYLLATQGRSQKSLSKNKHLIVSYQVSEKDSLGTTLIRMNGLDNYPKPLYLLGSGDTLLLFNQEAGVIEELVLKGQNTLTFPCMETESWSAFCGSFELNSSSGNQTVYQRQTERGGSILFEEIKIKSLKNP